MLRTSVVLDRTADKDLAKLSSINLTIYNPIIVMVKVSILLQYITIFVVHRGTFFHYIVQILIWTNVLYYTLTTLMFIFEVSNRFLLPLVVKFEEMKKCLREKVYPPTKILGTDHLWALLQSESDGSCIWRHQCCLGLVDIDLTAPIDLATSDVPGQEGSCYRDLRFRTVRLYRKRLAPPIQF